MRDVFGWQYTQHETYYVMVTSPDRRIYLGLRGDVDMDAFHRDAHEASEDGRPFDIEHYVQTFPATQHQLFVIPAGTPHGSGEGNVVLEVSATPYLYSLRFYDWLREDDQGRQRPVHVEHAFANLNTARTGSAVAQDLVQAPRSLEVGDGWREEVIGSLPEMFFEVRRLVLGPGSRSTHEMDGRFHVLNIVEGEGVEIESRRGDRHSLVYAETIVIPAAVGSYTIRTVGSKDVRVVKALVR
jgi:mannose-6-phosphate isomerase class I